MLIFDPKYIEDTINLLIYRFRGDNIYTSEFIRNEIYKTVTDMKNNLGRSFLHPSLIIIKHGRVMHKIRAQLFGLELQGDSVRSESIKNYIYGEMSGIDLSKFTETFNYYNNLRIQFMISQDETLLMGTLPIILLRFLYLIEALLVDLYTLARMFRKYPVEYQTGNKSITPHISPSYIIEYAGFEHIKIITKYLSSQGAEVQLYNAMEGNMRCVQVPYNFLE